MSEYNLGQQQPFSASQDRLSYPEESKAVTVFILGILGVVTFPLIAPFAWAMGNRELAAIDAGRRSPEHRQLARAGQVLGIVISVLLILFVVLVFAAIAFSLLA